MQAIILAAGEGVRLRPYTILTPKPLFTIRGIPIITFQIDRLNKLGIKNKEIAVVVNYLSDELIGFLKRFHKGVKIIFQVEKKGTSGALESAKEFVNDEEIIVFYGDIIFEDDLKEFINEKWSIATYEVDDVSRFGKIIEKEGYLEEIKEKSEVGRGMIFAGLLKIKREFFDILHEVKPNEKNGEYYLTDAILIQSKKTPFKIYKLKGKWYDIGSEESLKIARANFNKK